MKDKLIICTAKNEKVRIIAAQTTELVSVGTSIHKCAPTASAAFGRMLTAGALMGAQLKSEKEKMTIQIDGKGIAKGILVSVYSNLHVKGYIVNPDADLPKNAKNKLDVSGIVGKNGTFTVIKDLGLREPYIGKVPIYTGEIAEDLAYYFAVSEQVPSAVSLGVLVDKDLSIKYAGGFIIQLMPGAEEQLADLITERLKEMKPITKMMSDGMDINAIIESIFNDMELKVLETRLPEYFCDCSEERVESAMISLGRKELENIYKDNKDEEICCDFCKKKYILTHKRLGEIIENM